MASSSESRPYARYTRDQLTEAIEDWQRDCHAGNEHRDEVLRGLTEELAYRKGKHPTAREMIESLRSERDYEIDRELDYAGAFARDNHRSVTLGDKYYELMYAAFVTATTEEYRLNSEWYWYLTHAQTAKTAYELLDGYPNSEAVSMAMADADREFPWVDFSDEPSAPYWEYVYALLMTWGLPPRPMVDQRANVVIKLIPVYERQHDVTSVREAALAALRGIRVFDGMTELEYAELSAHVLDYVDARGHGTYAGPVCHA